MNYAIPVLVCHLNEDFRAYLREILTKHGFFHVIEISSEEEMTSAMNAEKKFFAIIHSELASHALYRTLQAGQNGSIFISQNESPKTMEIAVQIGVKNILSFPFSSQQLVDKILKHQ